MKKLIHLPLVLGVALLLGACSTISSRIEEKAPVFYSLDANTRAKISQGDIDLGFTPDMVYIALGNPDSRRSHLSQNGQTETWIYRSYYEDYQGTQFVGYRRWYTFHPHFGYRFYWRPVHADLYRTVAEDDIRVTFRDGKVVMIDQARA